MANHAGFAAALAISQDTLQEFLKILHHANQLTHKIEGNFGLFSADMFLETPEILCSSVAGNRLTINLTARGQLTFAAGISRTVLFRARVVVPPLLSLNEGALIFNVDGPSAVLEMVDIDTLAGGPFPPEITAVLDTQAFKDTVQAFIRDFLTALGQLAPPMDVGFLGNIATSEGTTVTPKIVDDAMVIGFDVTDVDGVTTHGSAGQLTNITAGYDLGMWTNPAALPVLMRDTRTQAEAAVAAQSATLTSLNFTLQEGSIHISGHADKGSDGSVDFSMDAIPHLIRPGIHEEWEEEYGEHFEYSTPDREELWFEVVNVSVNVNRPWWAYLLSTLGVLLTFGIVTIIIESIVGMIRNNISSGISQSGGGTVGERVQEFTFAGTTEPLIRLKIETYECHVNGMFTGITLTPQYSSPKVLGLSSINVESVSGASIKFSLRLPFEQHPDDPMLFIRWTVRRSDTNAVLRTVDRPAAVNLEIDLSGEPALLEASLIMIECRLYSVFGPITTDLYQETVSFRICDRLDRSHPFVRWAHEVVTPVVQVEADGSRTQMGYNKKIRVSNIHRTDVPGRCRMVSQYSYSVSPTDESSPHLEYLDALPFPEDEIVEHRRVLCDYCFFGGPDKTTPIL